MIGLQKILKLYGETTVTDASGKSVKWVWDYAKDEPRIKSEMTKDEIKESEKAKWKR
jgi:major membrane immunogen (membrane-anchored lipoprotein)